MYTTNPDQTTYNHTATSTSGTTSSDAAASKGLLRMKSIYVYIGATLGILILAYLISQFLDTTLMMHFGMFAGVLLLVANLRDFLKTQDQYTAQPRSTALMNTLIGGSLVCAWLSQIVGVLLWVPALLLIGAATPLVIGRASLYYTYIHTAQQIIGQVKGKAKRP
jgi:uncharacterized membrane protein YfcA